MPGIVFGDVVKIFTRISKEENNEGTNYNSNTHDHIGESMEDDGLHSQTGMTIFAFLTMVMPMMIMSMVVMSMTVMIVTMFLLCLI